MYIFTKQFNICKVILKLNKIYEPHYGILPAKSEVNDGSFAHQNPVESALHWVLYLGLVARDGGYCLPVAQLRCGCDTVCMPCVPFSGAARAKTWGQMASPEEETQTNSAYCVVCSFPQPKVCPWKGTLHSEMKNIIQLNFLCVVLRIEPKAFALSYIINPFSVLYFETWSLGH